MIFFSTGTYNKAKQHAVSVAAVVLVAGFCFFFSQLIGYMVVALLLLMTVSVLAMVFDILPVLVAAVLSALIWNYFFIPPLFTFHIHSAEDLLMFLMYFVIALVHAVLTFKIRESEKRARDKEEKENAIKLYNSLLHSLSHEMRTPLSTIMGAVDTLRENRKNLSSESKNELLAEIDTASIRLNRNVENLLNMSRLETGMLKVKTDWCDVNELMYSVIQKFSQENHQHHLLFKANESLPFFKLDAGLIETVLHNLIHNAIQYTPAQTTIQLKAYQINESLCLSISDQGPGFSEHEKARIFDTFYRLPKSKTGGTGLGLSIVKGFVLAHKGSIQVLTNQEGGATFTITIPSETSYLSNLKNE
ncbi:MAG TPA: DUF4118 domain-containing protein [Chitinophagaceae bacterium]|nr:DUF4118 domain-containing protein [Chitinophagaceae bacterium]